MEDSHLEFASLSSLVVRKGVSPSFQEKVCKKEMELNSTLVMKVVEKRFPG